MVSQSSSDLETMVKKRNTWKGVISLVFLGSGVLLFGYHLLQNKDNNAEVKEALAPHALYFEVNPLGRVENFPISKANEDVNNDGLYESVLRFQNPVTGQMESRLIEVDSGLIKIRAYEVIDGQINYLSNYLP